MKLNVTIDLDDIWIGEDWTISDSIAEELKGIVAKQLFSACTNDIREQFREYAKAHTQSVLDEEIKKMTEDVVKNGIIPSNPNRATEMPVRDYIISLITENGNCWNIVKDSVNRQVDLHVNQLKARYDQQFAAGVITKMKQLDMLKPGVAEAILTNNP